MTYHNLISLLGLFVLALAAWVIGGMRRPVPWRTVLGSSAMLISASGLVFLFGPTRQALVWVNDAVVTLLAASGRGARFLFGPLALSPGQTTDAGEPSIGFVFAAQVLPAVIFFAALMALAYQLGLIQPVIRLFARLFHRGLGLSGAEALAGASNIFVGVESATTVRPYLSKMTNSELLTLLTCAMSTVASTTLAVYVFFLQNSFPQIAGHLISASLLSIPAAVLVSKLMLPETQTPATLGSVPPQGQKPYRNPMSALAEGSWDGLKLAAGITTLLIAILGVVGIIDATIGGIFSLFGDGSSRVSMEVVLGWIFTPGAWLLGIETADITPAARMLGKRVVLTEIVAYQDLGALADSGQISMRTQMIMSYALCGFAHVASVGIFVGGISALAPDRRGDLSALGVRALAGATIATLMTGALAGLFYHGQSGLFG